ncbi:DUF1697 domain-containing protein [Saccharospirillum alexandrii]|uniref:DUF1697 domain-containing protein n=1 Tax=Saccharospirillum alexandrii TaxID=2448477 RepID=UPI0013DEC8F0|nr:DUF1697 domain-containing protein [Saccharospirillum alexandrii]
MNTYIALFRGINVGGKNILPMKELVSILETLGYENVKTYIQSGNVVFQSARKQDDDDADEIGKSISSKMGFEPMVMLLSYKQLQTAVQDNPFPTEVGKALHFFFLKSQPKQPNLKKLEVLKLESEEFKLMGNVLYLYAPDGVGTNWTGIVKRVHKNSSSAENYLWSLAKKSVEVIHQDKLDRHSKKSA